MTNISAVGQKTTVNMMRLFKRRLVCAGELKAILSHVSEEERCLGHLPTDWFGRKKTDEEKAAMTKDVFKAFSFFAKGVYSKIDAGESIFESFLKFLKKDLRKITKKQVSMSYWGKGLFGKVFKLRINNKDYAVKVFHMSDSLNNNHGKSKEIANAIAYNHSKKRSSRADFYFGKIAGEFDMDGFLVTEFVHGKAEEIIPPPGRYEYRRFWTPDAYRGYNTINGKLLDFGGIYKNFSNKKAEKMAKTLSRAILRGEVNTAVNLIRTKGNTPEYKEVVRKFLQEYSEIKENQKILYYEHTDRQRIIFHLLESDYICNCL